MQESNNLLGSKMKQAGRPDDWIVKNFPTDR